MTRLYRNALLAVLLAAALCMLSIPAAAKVLLKPANGKTTPMFTRSISANVTIDGQFAVTDLTLVFINATANTTEADFMYTLPPGAIATYFAYWAEDEKVVARIVEKQQAAKIYSDLTTVSHDPALVEMTGKNTFRARVSPIFAFKDLKIQLRFVQLMPSDKTGYAYTLPIADDSNQDDELEGLDVNITARPGNDVARVTNNYGLPISRANGAYTMKLSTVNYRPSKDLNVRFARKQEKMAASLYAARSGGSDGYFALALTPDHSLSHPRVCIEGVRTYEIAPARLSSIKAGESLLITGRYKGSGPARVKLNGEYCYSYRINFRSGSEPENLASKLWAAQRIRELSANKSNRVKVIELSKLYTLPSKYTSWLAVPKEEMRNYKRSLHSEELRNLTNRLAELIASNKEASAEGKDVSLKLEALCKEIDTTVDIEIGNSLFRAANQLAEEIAMLNVIGEGSSPSVVGKKTLLTNICKRISPESGFTSDPKKMIASNSKYMGRTAIDISRKLVDLIEQGKENAPETVSLRKQITELDAKLGSNHLKECLDEHSAYATSQLYESKYVKTPDEAKITEIQLKLKRLRSAGAREPNMDKLHESYINYAIDNAANNLMTAIANGKSGNQLSAYWKRYNESTAEYKNTTHAQDALVLCAKEKMENLAIKLIGEGYKAEPSSSRIKKLRDILASLQPYSSQSIDAAIKQAHKGYLQNDQYNELGVSRRLAETIINGTENTGSAKKLRAQFEEICRNAGADADTELKESVNDSMYSLMCNYAYWNEDTHHNATETRRMQNQFLRAEKFLGDSYRDNIEQYRKTIQDAGKQDNVSELDTNIVAELCKNKPDRAKLAQLRSQIRPMNEKMNNKEYAAAYDEMLDAGMAIVDVRDDIRAAVERRDTAKLAELKKKESEVRAEFSNRHWYVTVKWGDPLISVQAPKDSKQVVAILPDGEVKVLSYNDANQRWEARFDVPASVSEGEYSIDVIVVLPDDTRKVMTLKYTLDVTPPKGHAEAITAANGILQIRVEADSDTARAVAVLPWNERIELRHTGEQNTFGAAVPLPAHYQSDKFGFNIILTDSAHNRTEIPVQSEVK